MTTKIPTKDIELWLAGWTKSHNGGVKVTFTINDDDLPYFEHATIRKGKHAGQRYQAVLVQLNDDETPDQESVKVSAKPLSMEDVIAVLRKEYPDTLIGAVRHNEQKAHMMPDGKLVPAPADAITGHRMPEKTKAHFPGGFCGLAVKWCDDEQFRDWIAAEYESVWLATADAVNLTHKSADSERVAHMIKGICGVASRKDLDTDKDAHERFDERIRQPYMAFIKEGGLV